MPNRSSSHLTLLDGAMGTALAALGAPIEAAPGSPWAARAVADAPEIVRDLHRRYALAGATVHTANTFRADTPTLITRAIELARSAIAPGDRVAGSMGPTADCYELHDPAGIGSSSPLSLDAVADAHVTKAKHLLAAGADLLLLETFANGREAIAAVEACTGLGAPVWLALTAGPNADLQTPAEMAHTAREGARLGADAVLVNCTAAKRTLELVIAIRGCGVEIGAYANAGAPEDELGYLTDWGRTLPEPANLAARARKYAVIAQTWVDHGATIIGGCCGTFPEHIEALRGLSVTNRPDAAT